MRIHLRDVQLKKPKTSYEKDGEAEVGVMPVTTLTIEVEDMDPDDIIRLARHAHYKHTLSLTLESPQQDLMDMASRNGGAENG